MAHSRLGLAEGWGNLQSVRFNQDMSSFVTSFQDGLRIFNIDPIREQAHYTEEAVGSVGSVNHADMLYRSCWPWSVGASGPSSQRTLS